MPRYGHTRREFAAYRMHQEGYMEWKTSFRRADGRDREFRTVRVHTLLAIAEGAEAGRLFGKDSSHVVHHRNGIRWDNRPANLEVMSRGAHTSEHWEDRRQLPRDDSGRFREGFENPNPDADAEGEQ